MAAMLESMFRVRAGYTDPAIIEQDSMVLFRRQALLTRFRPSLAERCRVVSSCELNTSLPWCVHTSSIKLVFYEYPKRSLFRSSFGLRCFQPLSANA